MQTDGGATSTVSSTFAYAGTHSAYFYNSGSTGSTKDGYPLNEWTTTTPSHYRVQLWIYVPSTFNGSPVQFTDWVSFMTLWLNPGFWQTAYPVTIDGVQSGGGARQITMNLYPYSLNYATYHITQKNPISWPLDQWWQLAVECDLHPGSNSTITIYQNNVPIISWTGNLGTTGSGSAPVTYDGIYDMHMGLYVGPSQGAFAIYNDDVEIYNLA
ncbi:MAG TPA: hypothetical protein VJR06_07605 [Nitrososphaerales archaeon]|nr:hypothetical protein [Nitrososphaerales archaeon]